MNYYIHVVLILISVVAISCSDNNTIVSDNDTTQPVTVTVTPTSGPPMTVIEIIGIDSTVVEADSVIVLINRNLSNLFISDNGNVATTIPLIIDTNTHWIDTTDVTYDIEIINTNSIDTIARGLDVFTVTTVSEAPGTVSNVVADFSSISNSLKILSESFVTESGTEEMFLVAICESLDSLINSPDSLSLSSALTTLQTDNSEYMPIIDALMESSGIAKHTAKYAQLFSDMANQTKSNKHASFLSAFDSAITMSDEALAVRMQSYLLIRDFGEELLGPTVSNFGLALSTFGLAIKTPNAIKILNAVLSITTFAINKLLIGILPAHIDSVTLDFMHDTIPQGSVTFSEKFIYASNAPPGISVLDITGVVLTSLGLVKAYVPPTLADQQKALKDELAAIEGIISYLLKIIRKGMGIYAGANNHIDLDPTITSVPDFQWKAQLLNPNYIVMHTTNSDIVTVFPDDPTIIPEWMANGGSIGEAEVYITTSMDPTLAQAPPSGFTYNYGVFGEDLGRSDNTSITVVESSDIYVHTTFPENILSGENDILNITAGYLDINQNEIPKENLNVTVNVTNGISIPTQGVTDNLGEFDTQVAPDNNVDSIIIVITVSDDRNNQEVDTVIAQVISSMFLEVDFPSEVTQDIPTALTARAGMINSNGDTTFQEGMLVTFGTTGGSTDQEDRITDSEGRVVVNARANGSLPQLRVFITAYSPDRLESVSTAVEANVIATIEEFWDGTYVTVDYGEVGTSIRDLTIKTVTTGNHMIVYWEPQIPTTERCEAKIIYETSVSEDGTASGIGYRLYPYGDFACTRPEDKPDYLDMPFDATINGSVMEGTADYQMDCDCYEIFTVTKRTE